ncbi:MAG: hypothetical protein QXX95_08225 [Nitrososphaerales archaeon]
MELEIIAENKNILLDRKEIKCVIKGAYGKIKRSEALEALSNFLNLDKKKLYLIRMENKRGTRDLIATCFYYEDPKKAEKQLPKHIFVRMGLKEGKKK